MTPAPSRKQEVLHQCVSPVSHFTRVRHTGSTRDPTRQNSTRVKHYSKNQCESNDETSDDENSVPVTSRPFVSLLIGLLLAKRVFKGKS